MCVDISHLVLEAPDDTNHQIIDYCLDSPECSDILPAAVVDLDVDLALFWE